MTRNFPADLKILQTFMRERSLYSGPIDGVWGDGSYGGLINAIKAVPLTSSPVVPIPTQPTINFRLASELIFHEAVIRQSYKDSGGVWTWSVGLTSATGHDVNRYIDLPQPMQRCMDIYVWALRNYTKQVDKVFAGVPLSPEEYAGAVSFHWNTGAIRVARWVQYFIGDNMPAAEESFLTWNKSGGKVVKGLTDRRKREADLIWRGIWSSDGKTTEYTRLTSNHVPVWSSAIRVDVRNELLNAFGNSVELVLDSPAQPSAIPAVPTLTPAVMAA